MPFKITLGEFPAKMHPEADLYIDNWLSTSDGFLFEQLNFSGEVLHDPDDATLAARLDAILASEVKVITTLQGRYSLGIIGKVVNRLRDRGVNVGVIIETIPETWRRHVNAPSIQYHGALDTSPSGDRPLRVFLCYCSADKAAARDLYKRTKGLGAIVWFDEESLIAGQDWGVEIQTAIRGSDLVLVCLSPRAVNKAGYVQKEIRLALDVAEEQPEGATYIIPVKLEECQVPLRLSRWHWVNLFEPTGADRLAQALYARAAELRRQRSESKA